MRFSGGSCLFGQIFDFVTPREFKFKKKIVSQVSLSSFGAVLKFLGRYHSQIRAFIECTDAYLNTGFKKADIVESNRMYLPGSIVYMMCI